MKRAMIITVGTGRDVENGIWFSICKQNPSHITLLITENSKTTALTLEERIIGRGGIEFQTHLLQNENDVEIIFENCNDVISSLLGSGYDKSDIVADYTSGTKSMSAALVLAAVTFELESISYVYGSERDKDTGRVISGSERLSVLSPKSAFEIKLLEQFRAFFNKYQFQAAYDLLDNQFFSGKRKDEAKLCMNLALAYNAWDKFDFRTALEIFGNCDMALANDKGFKSKIEKSKQWLSLLDREPDNLVKELFQNAERRSEEGKYDDAVARLYRTLEWVFQIEYKKVFQTETTEGLVQTAKMLFDKNNENALKYFQNEKNMKKLLIIRNESILAHGKRPIKKSDYESLRDLIESFIPEHSYNLFIKL